MINVSKLMGFICFIAVLMIGASGASAQERADSAALSQKADTLASQVSLGEVVVKASNVTHKGMKDVYVVTPEMKQGIYNAGELLKRVNGIVYDPISRSIEYLGSKNIVILLDSVPKSEDYIKKLSPDRFDRIDVVNFPTGEYLGYDALINFHTRPAYTGYECNLFNQLYAVPGQRLGHGKWFNREDAQADFTYTHEKWNIYATVTPGWNREVNSVATTRRFLFNNVTETTLPHPKNRPSSITHSANYPVVLAADYQINRYHSVSVQWKFTGSDYKSSNRERMLMSNGTTGEERTVDYDRQYHSHGNTNNIFGAYYRGNIKGWNLTASANYAGRRSNIYNDINRSDSYSLTDDRRLTLNYLWGYMTAAHHFGEKWQLSITDSYYDLDYKERNKATDALLSNSTSIYNYLTATAAYSPRNNLGFMLTAGFTTYHNSADGESLTKVLPRLAANMNWVAHRNCVARLSYSMTPSVPGVSMVQDYGRYTDSLMYFHGNPDLRPVTMHNLALRVTLFNMLTLMADYQRNHNEMFTITSLREVSGRPVAYQKPENGRMENLTLGFNFNKRFPRGFQLVAAANMMRAHASWEDESQTKWLPRASVTLYYYNERLGLSGQFDYGVMRSLSLTPQERTWGNYEQPSMSVTKYLLNGNLQLMLMYALPVHFFKHEIKSQMVSDAMTSSTAYDRTYYTDNLLSFSISYRLSGGKKVRKYDRPTGGL